MFRWHVRRNEIWKIEIPCSLSLSFSLSHTHTKYVILKSKATHLFFWGPKLLTFVVADVFQSEGNLFCTVFIFVYFIDFIHFLQKRENKTEKKKKLLFSSQGWALQGITMLPLRPVPPGRHMARKCLQALLPGVFISQRSQPRGGGVQPANTFSSQPFKQRREINNGQNGIFLGFHLRILPEQSQDSGVGHFFSSIFFWYLPGPAVTYWTPLGTQKKLLPDSGPCGSLSPGAVFGWAAPRDFFGEINWKFLGRFSGFQSFSLKKF